MKVSFYIIYFFALLFGDRCIQEFSNNRERPNLELSYLSISGHFIIHYDIEGNNAPNLIDSDNDNIPDYIESVALIADQSRDVLINIMNYLPEPDDGDGFYDIYIVNQSAWGWNIVENSNTGASYVKIDNNYDGNNFNSDFCLDNLDKMKISVAHEFFHAIQRAYRPNPSNDHDFFLEMSSMWFEDLMVPDCNDYLSFVDALSYSIFNNPVQNFDGSDLESNQSPASFGYSMALFGHYLSTSVETALSNQFQSTIMRKIWENYSSGIDARDAIIQTVETDFGDSFSRAWTDFISSNLFCGYYDYFNNDIYYYEDQQYIEPILITPSDYIFSNNAESYLIQVEPYSANIFTVGIMEDMSIDVFLSDSEQFYAYQSVIGSNNTRTLINNANLENRLNGGDRYNLILTSLSDNTLIDIDIESEDIPIDQFSITLAPNPISLLDNFLIIIDSNFNIHQIEIKIYDISGHLIDSILINPQIESGLNNLVFPIQNYLDVSGAYVLDFVINSNKKHTEKIIFIK